MGLDKKDLELIKVLEELGPQYWDFVEEDTRQYTHGFHNYPAVMVSPISRNIIRIVKGIREVDSVFDPFVGSGTVMVEAMLSGVSVVGGNDINPLALLLTKVKTTVIPNKQLKNECEKLLNNIKSEYEESKDIYESADDVVKGMGYSLTDKKGWATNAHDILLEVLKDYPHELPIDNFFNMGFWFKPRVLLFIELIKKHILEISNNDIRDFCFVALSETIRLASNKKNGEFKLYRMWPEKVEVFRPDVIKTFSSILNRNVVKMKDFEDAMTTKPKVNIYCENTKILDSVKEKYDLIITSPPYGDSRTTVAYGQYSRLSLQLINLNDMKEKEIIDIDKTLMGGVKYTKGFNNALPSKTLAESLNKISAIDLERAGDVFSFYKDLDETIKSISKKTNIGGYQFWVVGNRTVKNEYLSTDKILAELAEQYGLVHVYTCDRNIPNKVMPSLNSPTNEVGKKVQTMCKENIVVLKKVSD